MGSARGVGHHDHFGRRSTERLQDSRARFTSGLQNDRTIQRYSFVPFRDGRRIFGIRETDLPEHGSFVYPVR